MPNKNTPDASLTEPLAAVTRRGFLKLAGVSGLAGAAGSLAVPGKAATLSPDGTPEQVHLTWGADPSSEVVVSWASLAPAVEPRVQFSVAGGPKTTVHGVQRRIPTDSTARSCARIIHVCAACKLASAISTRSQPIMTAKPPGLLRPTS